MSVGLYGTFIIDPGKPGPTYAVDRTLVVSEWTADAASREEDGQAADELAYDRQPDACAAGGGGPRPGSRCRCPSR